MVMVMVMVRVIVTVIINDLDYREIRGLNIKIIFNRRCPRPRRRSFLNSLILFSFVKFVTSR